MQSIKLINWNFDFDGKNYAVTVPGDISNDLHVNGLIPDPLFGDNFEKLRWIHERDWTYVTEFKATEDILAQERIELLFEGVDTFAEIYLNDGKIGSTHNMFRAYTFDVKEKLKKGKNVLKVRIRSVRGELEKYDNKNKRYDAAFNTEGIFLRKVRCHFGWDWALDFPGTGIYKSVYLRYGVDRGIESVCVRTNMNGATSFVVETDFNNRRLVTPDIFDGKIVVEVFAPSGKKIAMTEKEVFGSKNLLTAQIDDPLLWYPNGYGEQPLYTYKAYLTSGDIVCDQKEGRFGIRETRVEEPVLKDGSLGFDFYVNNVRIRCVGGNWVPCSPMTGAIKPEKYERLLQIAKSAGINMLRIWGGGLYEADCFYDYCDEKGILLWQDFMFSCETVPDDIPEFCREVEAEATEQIVRLRNHPSVFLWCGGNEITDAFKVDERKCGRWFTRVVLPGLVSELDGDRRYVNNSPYSQTGVGNDISSGDCHKNAQAITIHKQDFENFRTYQWANMNNFDSECAQLGMCRVRSFKNFMPEDKLWPQNELWTKRIMANPHDWCVPDFTMRLNAIVDGFFGGFSDLYDFIKKSMIGHAELLQSEIDYYRSQERNSGVLSWMYNDYHGNGTWSIVDDSLEAKPALYAMKRAGKRLRVNITLNPDGKYYVNVVNDTAKAYNGTLRIGHETLQGEKIFELDKTIAVPAFTQTRFPLEVDTGVKDAYLYAKIDSDETVFFYRLWKYMHFVTDIKTDVVISGCEAEVTVKANEFARTVFIDLPQGYYAEYSDNYFDLRKGETKTVLVHSDKPLKEADLKVLTFADTWRE